MNFEKWWDTEAKTPAPDTFRNWEASCRQAYQVGRESMIQERDALQARLNQQAAMVEKCMTAMNENADRGETAERELAALKNPVVEQRTCPKCGRCWPVPCQQQNCIDRHGECITCRFIPKGPINVHGSASGTAQELEQL